MSKVALIAVIVLSTIECIINGKKVTFLPSNEPQEIPKSDAEEVLNRGLAKLPEKLVKTRASKPKTPDDDPVESGDSEGDQSDDEIKDQVGV